jgi:hypothetical protein
VCLIDYKGNIFLFILFIYYYLFLLIKKIKIGYRLIAISMLPISDETLVYGSSDGVLFKINIVKFLRNF